MRAHAFPKVTEKEYTLLGQKHTLSKRLSIACSLTLATLTAIPAQADTYAMPPTGDDVVGKPQIVITREKDTLLDIARSYDLGYDEIAKANPGVDPWLPKPGTRILLPTRFILPKGTRQGIVLNVAEMRLYFFPKAKPGQTPMVVTHPVGIGREGWSTPIGETKVASKRANPKWYVPPSILKEHAEKGDPLPRVVAAGPDNPLGNYAMPLGIPGYLIHGTNKPFGIGRRVSHGCIQLYPEDIEGLFKDIPVGTPVRIINQPYKAGWLNDKIYLETHEPLGEDVKDKAINLTPMVNVILDAAKDRKVVNWDKATEIATRHIGIPMSVSVNTPSIDEELLALNQLEPVPNQAARDDAHEPSLAEVTGQWFIKVGGLDSQENAYKLAAMLRHLGPPIPAMATQDGGAYQVLSGPYRNRAEALKASRRINTSLEVPAQVMAPLGSQKTGQATVKGNKG